MPGTFCGEVIICCLKGTEQETAGSVIGMLRIWVMEFQPSGVLLLDAAVVRRCFLSKGAPNARNYI
jgi:hypothetical protein